MRQRMSAKRSRTIQILGLVCLLLVLAYIGLRVYLSSGWVVSTVTSQLKEQYGGIVNVDAASIGLLGSSSLTGLQLFEGEENETNAWLQVAEVQADLSALGLLTGNTTPSRLTLREARIQFRWDKSGSFVTRLPDNPKTGDSLSKPLPKVSLENSQLVLAREGQTDVVINGIRGTLSRQDDGYDISGDVAGKDWGDWKIEGAIRPGVEQIKVKFSTKKPVFLTENQLRQLPFIADQVWENITASGRSTGWIELTLNTKSGALDYRVEIVAVDNTVTLPEMKLTTTNINQGKVIIHNNKADIDKVRGKTLGGNLDLSGNINFETADLKITLPSVKVSGVPVKNIPENWKFPLRLEGDLSAGGQFSATMQKDTVKITGQVNGQIRKKSEAKAKATFELSVNATDKGITWSQGSGETDSEKKEEEKEAKQSSELRVRQLSEFIRPLVFATVFAVQDQKKPDEQPEKKQDRVELKLKLDEVDIAEYIKSTGLKLPVPVTGIASLEVKMMVPTNDLGDLKKYTVMGSASAKKLKIADLLLESAEAMIVYDKGILDLNQLEARLPNDGGKVSGVARVEVLPFGQLSGKLMADSLALNQLSGLLKDDTLGGTVSGQLEVSAPVKTIQDPATWTAMANVTSEKLKAFGLTLNDGQLAVSVKDGVAELTTLKGKLESIPVSGSAKLMLKDNYPFRAELKLPEGDLNILNRLPEDKRPPIQLSGRVDSTVEASGTLQPLAWKLGGTVKASQVKAFQTSLDMAEFAWTLDGKTVTISDLSGKLYDGQVSGKGTLPLLPDQAGTVQLDIKGMKATPLAKELKLPFLLSGTIDGSLKADIPVQKKVDMPRDISAALDLTSKALKFQGVTVEEMTADVQLKTDVLEYKIKSKALKGNIEVEGKFPLRTQPKPPSGTGVLRMTDIDLAELRNLFDRRPQPVALSGKANLQLTYRHDAQSYFPTGKGEITVTNLKWQRTRLAPSIKAELTISPNVIALSKMQGQLAGGSVQGELTWDLRNSARSRFSVRMTRVDTGKFPPLKDILSGAVTARLSGTLSRNSWFGQGEVDMARGELAGVSTQLLRLPFRWRFFPISGNAIVIISRSSALVAHGKVTGHGTVRFGRQLGIDSKIHFTNVELGSLVREATSFGSLGSARVSGDVILKGYNIRSPRDFKGSVRANFGRSQALTFPVLRQVAPVIGQTPSTAFTKGELEATITNGTVRVEELSLVSNALQIFADGVITFEQRLDLNVVAKTGPQGVTNYRLRFLASKIPAIGPVPVGTIVQAARILNDRVVYLQVTGTLRAPVVGIRPLKTLSENAVRFFVEQVTPIPGGAN